MNQRELATLLAGPSHLVAPELLGAVVSTAVASQRVSVRLTEVEAYGGTDDPASHAYRSRTARNEPMWGPPGTVYVYLSYGLHWCANVVTAPQGTPAAVLLRGGVLVAGHETAAGRRGRRDHLTDGPGKLAQALGLDGSTSGTTLWDGPISITPTPERSSAFDVTPRIGITKATARQWRFVQHG